MTEDMLITMMMPFILSIIPITIYSLQRAKRLERKEIRQQYAELVKEKLDIIRTALAMGKDGDEIAILDKRLEKIIGTEKMLKTLAKGEPDSEAENLLKDVDLIEEVDRLAESKPKVKE